MKPKIGVFDSGVGGKSVAKAIEKALPEHEVILVEDKEHVPYGTKNPEQLLKLVEPLLQNLSKDCAVIVIACNTVSTTLIEQLRSKISIPLIAMEPMVKPAAKRTKTGVITVCATPTTLASKRYQWLKDTYAKNIKVIEPDCSDWSYMIENNQLDQHKIADRINASLDQKSDVIVLGCTHYHWIEELIKQIVGGKAVVLQPEAPVIEQLKTVLAQLG
jgi:glutamate racemase